MAEQLFIHQVIQDPRGWAHYFPLALASDQNQCDVLILKVSNAFLARLYPEIAGFSVAVMDRYPQIIYINQSNWTTPPANFEGSLTRYRTYVIQHEIGHCLGYGHRRAPKGDATAICPVMYQQTRGTRGKCRSNPWVTKE